MNIIDLPDRLSPEIQRVKHSDMNIIDLPDRLSPVGDSLPEGYASPLHI